MSIITLPPRGPGSETYVVASLIETIRRAPGCDFTEITLTSGRMLTTSLGAHDVAAKVAAALKDTP